MDSLEKRWSSGDEKQSKTSNTSWVRRLLPRPDASSGEPSAFDMREQPPIPPRPPLPLEKLLKPQSSEEDDEEEDKGEEEKESSKQDVVQPAVESVPAAAAAEAAVSAPAESSESEAANEETEETAAVESEEPTTNEDGVEAAVAEPEGEVFETIAGSTPTLESPQENTAEFTDLPHVEADKPSIPLTPEENKAFASIAKELEPQLDLPPVEAQKPQVPEDYKAEFESIVQREMPQEFAAATSGNILGDTGEAFDRREPPIPSWNMPAARSPFEPTPSGETFPSWPIGGPPPIGGEALGSSSAAATSAEASARAAKAAAETAANARRAVVGTLTSMAVLGYLMHRRRERELARKLDEQRQEIKELTEQQRISNEQIQALQKQAEQAAAMTGGEREIIDPNGNRIVLKPGERLERAPAGYSFVIGENGRVINDALPYEKEFKNEQQREQLSEDTFAALYGGPAAGVQDGSSLPASPPPTSSPGQQTPVVGQYPFDQSGQVDLNHRLMPPRRPIREAALNPWLWTAVAILIIIYFVASLA